MSNWFVEPMKDEVPYSEILKKAENGEFHEWNFQPLDFQENGYEDVIDEIKKYTAVDYLHLKELKEKAEKDGDKQAAQEYADKMEEMVQAVMKIYRTKNIFPIQYFSEFGILDEIAKCIAYKAEFDGNTVSCVTGDTEFFNGKEWKRIDEYADGDKVLQYNPDGTATLVEPLRYIHYQSDDPFYSHGVHCLPITTNHNIPVRSENGKIALTPLSSVFSLYNHIRTITIPASAEYNNHTGDISNQALLDTYAAVVWQDKKHMTVYNTIDEKENIILSDECFNLSLRNRRMLLSLFGLSEYVIDDLLEETFDNGSVWSNGNNLPKSLFSIISGLVSLSYKDVTLIKYDYISSAYLSKYDFMMTNKREWDKLEGVKDKYCFSVPSHMLVLRYKGRIHITGNCGAGIGTSLCNYLFPNLYDTPSAHDLDKENARSLFEKFHNDKYLRRAIEFCFGYKNGCPVPTSVTGGLRLVGSAPTNFRPMNAKAVYERFCPKGGTIYDFCCVSGDTEFFDGVRWKPIRNYKDGDRVLQFNPDGTANLVIPISYIHYKNTDIFYEYSDQTLSFCQTGNHDVVYYEEGEYKKVKQSHLTPDRSYAIPVTCIADGGESIDSCRLYDIYAYLNSKNPKESIYSREYLSEVIINKKNRTWLLNELFFFGTKRTVSVGNAENAEHVYNILRFSGEYGKIIENNGEYYVSWGSVNSDSDLNIGDRKFFSSYNGKPNFIYDDPDKYCFTVPSHMLVLRRKGSMYITGNCGFGGRLLGALSSKNSYKYVGTDPCTETMYHLHQLGQYIEQVTGREDSYELHCCGSEEFKGPKNSIDFAFSSPPYFNLEVYSDEPTQCFNKFPELEGWLEGFVRPTIQNIKHMLKPGKLYAVNIADFKVGSGKEVAYVDEWIRISTEEGMPLFDTVYLGVTARAGSAEQAAGELKKENILIFKKPLW